VLDTKRTHTKKQPTLKTLTQNKLTFIWQWIFDCVNENIQLDASKVILPQ